MAKLRVNLGRVAVKEALATVRTGLWPVARLRPLPEPSARPTRGLVPVVLVHGYMGHPDCLRNLSRHLLCAGFPRVERVAYPSVTSGLDTIIAAIAACVDDAGIDGPVDLVGHSLGAVACRAWLKTGDGAQHVRRFVAIGGPHAGTAWWRVTPPWLHDVLRPDGPWVRALNTGPEPVPTTVIRARYDQQVFPPRRARIDGLDEIVLDGLGHNGLLWDRRCHEAVSSALSAPDPAGL